MNQPMKTIARRPRLEQLGSRHQHEESRPGLDAVQRAVRAENRNGRRQHDGDAQG
jgi:hypothetical protein